MATQTPQEPRYCRQILTDPDGFRARCMATYGTEHSHHDYTARESVKRGIADADFIRVSIDASGVIHHRDIDGSEESR